MFTQSLKYSESKQNPYIYSNIGAILYIQEDWDKALQYFTNVLYLAKKHNDVQILCVYFINIGDFHKEKGNYPKAIKYLDRGLTIVQEHDEFIINNGIFLQSISSIFGLMKSFEEALEYIHRANLIFRNHGFHLNLARSLYELSKVHFEKDEVELATEALTESIQISTEQGYSLENRLHQDAHQMNNCKWRLSCGQSITT